MSETTTQVTENVKKISHGLINEAFKLDKTTTRGKFLGRILKARTETSTKNGKECLQFQGEFQADVAGKLYRGHKMYAPEIVETELGLGLASAVREAGDAFAGLDFAVEIYRVESTKSVTGYEWRFVHLLKPQEQADPISQILARIALPALPTGISDAVAATAEAVAKKKH